MVTSRALVCLSGGQDSTTCLYWARERFDEVEAIAFDYGQRHRIELDCAAKVAARIAIPLFVLPISALRALGGSSLTDDSIAVSEKETPQGLPSSFVPGRNLLFLTLAAARAYQRGIEDLVTGVCQTDYSGYPDCRDETMKSLQASLQLGMAAEFRIHTPLMWLTKAESVSLAASFEGCLEALADSHTCYQGQRPPCGDCAACVLRARGFAEAGVPDPLLSGPA